MRAQRKLTMNLYRMVTGGRILLSQQIKNIVHTRWLCNAGSVALQELSAKFSISAEQVRDLEPDNLIFKEVFCGALVCRYFFVAT